MFFKYGMIPLEVCKQIILHFINTQSLKNFNLDTNNIADNRGNIVKLFPYKHYNACKVKITSELLLLVLNIDAQNGWIPKLYEGYIVKAKLLQDYDVKEYCSCPWNNKLQWHIGDDIDIHINYHGISAPLINPIIYTVVHKQSGLKIYGSWKET